MGTWTTAGTAVLCVFTRGHDCQVRVRVTPWLRFPGDATALLPEHRSKEMTLLLTSRKPSGYCGLPGLDSDTQGLTKPVEPHTPTPMACYY